MRKDNPVKEAAESDQRSPAEKTDHPEKDLLKEIAFIQAIEKSLPSGISVIDESGKLVYINPAFCNMVGMSSADLVGQFPPFAYWPPEEIEKITKSFEMTLSDEAPSEGFELIFLHKSGLRIPVRVISSCFKLDGERTFWLANVIDITQKKQSEFLKQRNQEVESENEHIRQLNIKLENARDEALKNDSKFKSYVEHAPDGVIVADEKGHYLEVNAAACNITGYTKHELLSMSIHSLASPESQVEADLMLQGLQQTGTSRADMRFVNKKGEIRWWTVESVKLSENRSISFVKDITERKKTQEEITKSNERYLGLVQNLDVGIIVHAPDTSIIANNPKASEYLGLTEDQLMGKHAIDPEWHFLNENKSALAIEQYPVNQILATRMELKNQTVGINRPETKDIAWFLVNGFPFLNHRGELIEIVISFIDITKQKQAEETLKSKLLLMASMDSLKDTMLYSLDPGYRFLYFNKVFADFMKISLGKDIHIGYPMLECLSSSEERTRMKGIFDLVMQGESVSKISTLGILEEEFIESFYNPLLNEQNRIIGITALSKNITERKQMEYELIKAKEKAEESEKLKTAFLQNMSHEIRTPLNAISGFLQMLEKPDLSDEKRKSFSSIIIHSSHQLLSIVNDILTISSIETKQEKVNITNMNVNSIILDLLTIFKVQAAHQNISIYSKQNLTDIRAEIYSDPVKITQILSNLISNALKFTHQGSVDFGYELKKGLLEFYVKDSGIGIQPEQQENIFERFRQADLSISKHYGGTGLGLSISKGFVELLGGSLWMESAPEQGSSFYFTIPYSPVNETNESDSPAENLSSSPTILIAEDVEINFLLLEELFNGFGYRSLHAKNGKVAVELCKTVPEIVLVFMDIKMPVQDGFSAAKMIREFKPDLPIIAQSGYSFDDEREKYGDTFNEYISKPFDLKELENIAKKYIHIA